MNLLIKIGTNTLIAGLALCIPTGVFLAFWLNDARWLWLSAPLLIFLS